MHLMITEGKGRLRIDANAELARFRRRFGLLLADASSSSMVDDSSSVSLTPTTYIGSMTSRTNEAAMARACANPHVRSISNYVLRRVHHSSATMPRHDPLRRALFRARNRVTASPDASFAARTAAALGSPAARGPRPSSFHCLATSATAARAPTPPLHLGNPHSSPLLGRHELFVRCFHSEAEYHRVADDTLRSIQDAIDEAFEGYNDDAGSGGAAPTEYELNVASGVMTLSLPGRGTWVLNKQTPNRQIWWSSPLSGPKRFEYIEGAWCSTKDGLTLGPLLVQELRHVHPSLEIDLENP
jgi:frataxin